MVDITGIDIDAIVTVFGSSSVCTDNGTQTATAKWAPLGNATVTWA